MTIDLKLRKLTVDEARRLAEDVLIYAYVPEADQMSREAALTLAMERDNAAATQLHLDAAAMLAV